MKHPLSPGKENKNCLESPSQSVRVANRQKATANTGYDAVKGESYTSSLSECRLQQPLRTSVREILKKLQVKLQCNPTVPLLRTCSQSPKSTHHKETCTSIFIATWVTIARKQNQPTWPPTDDWEESPVHRHRKEENEVMTFSGKQNRKLLC